MKYELIMILKPESQEEKVDEVIKRYETFITENKATFVDAEKWGRRALMSVLRRANHQGEGYYIMLHFDDSGAIVEKLNYKMKIDEDVLRSMVARAVTTVRYEEKAV